MSEDKKSAKVKVAGLWRNKSSNGNEYLSGNWGDARVLIFSNGYKRGEKEPDYHMYLASKPPPANPLAANGEPTSDGA